MSAKTVSLNEVLKKKLCDSEFRQAYEELEPSYQIARLRIIRGLTDNAKGRLLCGSGSGDPSLVEI